MKQDISNKERDESMMPDQDTIHETGSVNTPTGHQRTSEARLLESTRDAPSKA
jgi:hypothetical protein